MLRAPLVVLLICLGGPFAQAETIGLPDDYTIRAIAPAGLRRTDLGRPYTANFQPVTGKEGQPLFPDAPDQKAEDTSQFQFEMLSVDNSHELRANASGWGISAGIAASGDKRYLAYRVILLTSIDEVDDRTEPRTAARNAAYYIRRIYYGAMVDFVCSGTASAFTADVRAEFGAISGSIEGFAKKNHGRCDVKIRGIDPPDVSNALFLSNPDQIKAAYFRGFKKPVPILVEYRRIPNSTTGDFQEFSWGDSSTRLSTETLFEIDSGNSGWQNPGIVLQPGDTIAVVAWGEILLDKAKTKRATAGIIEYSKTTPCSATNANGGLRARVGSADKNSWYFPPDGRTAFLATDAIQGPLEFQIKDSRHDDNAGSYKVRIFHTPAQSVAAARCIGSDDLCATPPK